MGATSEGALRSPASDSGDPGTDLGSAFSARAFLIGERIDTNALELPDPLATAPLTVRVTGGGLAIIYRYGAVVLFSTPREREDAFLASLIAHVDSPLSEPLKEDVHVQINPEMREGVDGGSVYLHDGSLARLQIVADILGKSVLLDRYESRIAESFDRIEPLAEHLALKGQRGLDAKELLQLIGSALLSEHKLVGRAEVNEKPEMLWERSDLERFYLRLEDEFEIEERHRALERKLELISRTVHTVVDLHQDQRSLRVEWYIVILIVIEILLFLYELFLYE